MPDYVVLITTVGGLAVFGLAGFVVGPVIAALFIAVWEVVASHRQVAGTAAADANQPGPAPPS